MKKWLLALALCLIALPALASDGVFVTAVGDLPENFIFGADVSSVIALEKSGVLFKDAQGDEKDLFALLKENGWTSVRVRLWVDPYDARGNSYGGGVGSLEYACEIGRRAAENGLRLLVDFHYSDFWADPGKQQCPKAWQGMTPDEKAEAAYAYTFSCLTALREAGADVFMAQVGNETDNALAGEKSWTNIVKIMNAGGRAVREVFPDARVAVHFSQPKAEYARIMSVCRADYDVFAASYYCYWHGSMENMTAQMRAIREQYGKDVLIAETAYPYTAEDGDFHGNSVPDSGTSLAYALTVQGQANALSDVVRAANAAGCLGVYVWEPAWLPVPGDTFEEKQALWEKNGAGWASSYAAEYDPDDAGVWYGGCSWENQAFFAFDGTALPTLRLPVFLREGAAGERGIDGYETPRVVCYLSDGVTLPDTVDAVYTDGSREPVGVTWQAGDYGKFGEYTVAGIAEDGAKVTCQLVVTAKNALQNPGFEDEDISMYAVTAVSGAEIKRATSQNDAKNGTGLFHFYDEKQIDFDIAQTVTGLRAGSYTFSLCLHGGDFKETDMSIYVLLDGEPYASAPTTVTKWREWKTPAVTGIPVTENTVVTVGAHIAGTGEKPWGKLDDWLLAMEE